MVIVYDEEGVKKVDQFDHTTILMKFSLLKSFVKEQSSCYLVDFPTK
jgi:hypothetical protein